MNPEEIENKEFLVSLRGYDKDEVEGFLREVAKEIRGLRSEVEAASSPGAGPLSDTKAYLADIGAKVGEVLVTAEDAATDIREKASGEAERQVAVAKDEAARTVAGAREEAAELLKKARADEDAVRREIAKLKEARNLLATQLEDVGQRLSENVARLQMPVTEDEPEHDVPKGQTSTATPPITAAPKPVAPSWPQPSVVGPEKRTQPTPEKERLEKERLEKERLEKERLEKERLEKERAQEEPTDDSAALQDVLAEIRRERESGKRKVEEALADAKLKEPEEEGEPPDHPSPKPEAFVKRDEALGDLTRTAASKLKRLLQEDQNKLLDKIRTQKGKGSYGALLSPAAEQAGAFHEGLDPLLFEAFSAGRSVAGAGGDDEATAKAALSLVDKQFITPLRTELESTVDAAIQAGDTPTAVSERAGDIYRVWKSVRAEMLGEGLTYAVFHSGLLSGWESTKAKTKKWVFSAEEGECTNQVCDQNAGEGPISLAEHFSSGHVAPPAHGGCTCTMVADDG
jgi:DivIVA domain-containing protein